MANPEHVDILRRGVDVWNKWREENPEIEPDLSEEYLLWDFPDLPIPASMDEVDLAKTDLDGLDLQGINLSRAKLNYTRLRGSNLQRANLTEADLSKSILSNANLSGAELQGAKLVRTILNGANLSNTSLYSAVLYGAELYDANLDSADFRWADLNDADLQNANLRGTSLQKANLTNAVLYGASLVKANLNEAILIKTNLNKAKIINCSIYGISVWDAQLEDAIQSNLIITDDDEVIITVDNLEVAQFIYLLLNNQKIRHVINTITSKVVLILGRFTPERKVVLDALRDELRNHDLLPVVFDFDPSAKRDLTETITTLAHMARFIIADITSAKSIPQELQAIIPNLPSVPVQPLLHRKAKEYAMFEHFKSYPWVLEAYRYSTTKQLLASLKECVIQPAEERARELEQRKQG